MLFGERMNKIKLLRHYIEKSLWGKVQQRKEYRRILRHLAVRLALSIDIEEAIDLIREKLPDYEFPVERARALLEILEKIRFDYLWENIDFQRAKSLLLRFGIPEPYMLLAEFLLRDNGVKP